MRHFIWAMVCTFAISACGMNEPDPAKDNTVTESLNSVRATGFITTNQIPSHARVTRDDGVPRDEDGRPFVYGLLGKPIPEFSAQMLDQSTFSSMSLLGQWTIVDVWGLWCSDCMADAPFVADLASRLDDIPDVGFVSIHTPPSRSRIDDAYGKFPSLPAYLESNGYDYPTVVDADASIRELLQISWTPSYLLVDPSGVVRGFRTDLSVAGDDSIDRFLEDIERVRQDS